MNFLRFFVIGYFLFSPLFADEAAPSSSFTDDFLHMSSTLLILLLFLGAALFIVKKIMKGRMTYMNRSTSIKILEKRALHPKASLYLIETLGKTVLISESQGQINLITEINNPQFLPEEKENPPQQSFTEVLKKKLSLRSKKN